MTEVLARPTIVDESVLAKVLRPYEAKSCRYLQSATVTGLEGQTHETPELLTAEGRFAIETSCYIEDTGHFNSVELTIAYNQLFYTLVASGISSRRIPHLQGWTLDRFFRSQLPDILIRTQQVRFVRPIDARSFSGRIVVNSIEKRHRSVVSTAFLTSCEFSDNNSGLAMGTFEIVVVDRA